LIVTEIGVLRQIKNWFFFFNLVILIVEDFDQALSDEVHLLHVAPIADHGLPWSVDSAVHANNELIGKPSFTLLEEMVERFFKFFEHSSVLD
jgi:hypothetical protein